MSDQTKGMPTALHPFAHAIKTWGQARCPDGPVTVTLKEGYSVYGVGFLMRKSWQDCAAHLVHLQGPKNGNQN